MSFDFSQFLQDVGANLGVSDQEDLAGIAAKGIFDGVARIKDEASQQGSNPPIVTPTAYVERRLQDMKVFGFSLTGNQVLALKVGGVMIGGLMLYKLIRRR